MVLNSVRLTKIPEEQTLLRKKTTKPLPFHGSLKIVKDKIDCVHHPVESLMTEKKDYGQEVGAFKWTAPLRPPEEAGSCFSWRKSPFIKEAEEISSFFRC